MKRVFFAAIAGLVASMALAVPALADPAQTETTVVKNVSESFTEVLCQGGPVYDITITYRGVEHVTVKDGTFHFTFTQTGKFEAIDLGSGEVIKGSFAIWGGFNVNGQSVSGTFTFNARGIGDMGTRVNTNEMDHFNATPTGHVNEFFKGRCLLQ